MILTDGKKQYTVVCPGGGRYDEDQRKKMKKDDKRLHGGSGWYSEVFPVKCYMCGDEAQPRGEVTIFSLDGLS